MNKGMDYLRKRYYPDLTDEQFVDKMQGVNISICFDMIAELCERVKALEKPKEGE